mmetsp:Transcript_253/g.293  ORF Transcript_253/g.293 Transcript_253/m.293 type:complete len:249 (+) Transcript_253:730-1476(+)
MTSAVKTLTLSSSANSLASLATGTSKARITANLDILRSFITLALSTSRLWTGPILIPETGILTASLSRKVSSASNDPRVEACTQTPSPPLSTLEKMSVMSSMTASLSSSSESSGVMTNIEVPATAVSRPGATIFTPIAALISLWSINWPLMRSSRRAWGVFRALIRVTSGPPRPQTTILSPSRSFPFSNTTSTVVPRPSIVLTSNTEHWGTSTYMSRSASMVWVSLTMTWRRSEMPSPVTAEVGTTLT